MVEQINITTITQARMIISALQSSLDKKSRELDKARAIIYDLRYSTKPEPLNTELKAQVIRLETELEESIEKLRKLKEKIK